MEFFKDLSDKFVLWLLKISSGFNAELTADGREEQRLWRDQRLKNIKALSLRSQQRYAGKSEAA